MAAELFYADKQKDRQTDGHDDANSRFSQFCERVWKHRLKFNYTAIALAFHLVSTQIDALIKPWTTSNAAVDSSPRPVHINRRVINIICKSVAAKSLFQLCINW